MLDKEIENGATIRVAILGAGNVGCYVGAVLSSRGRVRVLFYGRERLKKQIVDEKHGIRAVDVKGNEYIVPADSVEYTTDPKAVLSWGPDYIIIASKGTATKDIVEQVLLSVDQTKTEDASWIIVSLQNGIRNPDDIREYLKASKNSFTVLGGMFPFNVASRGLPDFRQGTDSDIYIEDHPDISPLVEAMNESGLRTKVTNDIIGIQHGKLLFNLNNAINALSGLPLKHELSQSSYRYILAYCIWEGFAVFQKAGIQPQAFMAVPLSFVPYIMRLPDFLFTRIARSMLSINDEAKSSMLEDIELGRPTEIDLVNGVICDMGRKYGIPTPFNDMLVREIKKAEATKARPQMSGEKLLQLAQF